MKRIVTLLWIICCGLFVLTQFREGWHLVRNSGGCDLRTQVVGSRWKLHNQSPYTSKWQPGQPDRLLDPNDDFGRKYNFVTLTPAMLWLQAPLAALPYSTIRMVWYFLQWICFAFICFACWYPNRHYAVAAPVIWGIAALFSAFPHTMLLFERGQYYLLYTAFIAALYWLLTIQTPRAFLTAAILLGAGICLRPTLLAFAPAALILWPRHLIMKSAVAGAIMAITLILCSGLLVWADYFEAVSQHWPWVEPQLQSHQTAKVILPGMIEGMHNLSVITAFPDAKYLASLPYYFAKLGISLRSPLGFYGIALAGIVGLLFFYRKYSAGDTLGVGRMIVLGSCCLFWIEMCLPVRYSYNMLQWLPAAGLSLLLLFGIEDKRPFPPPDQP